MFCRKCGKKLLPDSNFCDKCGTEVSATPTGVETSSPAAEGLPEKAKRTSPWKHGFLTGIVLWVISAIILGFQYGFSGIEYLGNIVAGGFVVFIIGVVLGTLVSALVAGVRAVRIRVDVETDEDSDEVTSPPASTPTPEPAPTPSADGLTSMGLTGRASGTEPEPAQEPPVFDHPVPEKPEKPFWELG